MDHNSSINQRIKEKFVGQHVYANVTSLAEFVLRASYEVKDAPFDSESIENYYTYPEYNGRYASFEGGSEANKDSEIDRLRGLINELNDCFDESSDSIKVQEDTINDIESDIQTLQDIEQEHSEIYEWWIVSEWLMKQLYGQNECVIDGYPHMWGRGCTGQAILLDGVISRICEDMGILDGQENSWASSVA